MRNSRLEIFLHPVFLWGAPPVASLALTLLACIVTGTNVMIFPLDRLLALSTILLGFLGVAAAILIAVLTSIYVQSRRNQADGFRIFLESLNQFKLLLISIKGRRIELGPQDLGIVRVWIDMADRFIEKMNEITPAWRGYDYSRNLEREMGEYVVGSEGFLIGMARDDRDDSVVDEVRANQEMSIRNMIIGLRIIDEGAVERRLVDRLFGIFVPLVVLLNLSLLVRAVAGLEYNGPPDLVTVVNLFCYVLLPAGAIAHFIALLFSILLWRKDILKRDEIWAS